MHFYTIKEAIREGSRLKLSLEDGEHIVEPHVLGRDGHGATLLRAYEVKGPNRRRSGPPWKTIRLDHIRHAVESGGRFEHPRAGYKVDGRTMRGGIIECV
jgi:hypothetical protein